MENLSNLLFILESRGAALSRADNEIPDDMHVLFQKALKDTMAEIQAGADPEEFKDLTIINFIISCGKKDYSSESIQKFLHILKY